VRGQNLAPAVVAHGGTPELNLVREVGLQDMER
jgi:hypothetical protein